MRLEIRKCDHCGKEIAKRQKGSISISRDAQIESVYSDVNDTAYFGRDFCSVYCFSEAVKKYENWELIE